MPIYAYKCTDCGHEKEVLQKITDAPLRDCPQCGHASMAKMVTAAGFHLKGSGWYATDFRNKDSGGKNGKSETKTDSTSDTKADGKAPSSTGGASTHACGSGGCASCS
jgi:putative FmdB family regulatory protein